MQPALQELGDRLSKEDQDASAYYRYKCDVVKNELRGGKSAEKGFGLGYEHNYWSQGSYLPKPQEVLATSSFNTWRRRYEAGSPGVFTLTDTFYDDVVINPVTCAFLKGAKRTTTPSLVVWDLAWRPAEKRTFYWLYLRLPDRLPETFAKSYEPERAHYTPATEDKPGLLRIDEPNSSLGYLLKEDWLSNLAVHIGDDDKEIWSGTVQKQAAIEEATLNARGDLNEKFSAMIYLERNEGDTGWDLKEAQSLDG